MRLRTLQLEDAPYMLEWMHDIDVVKYMGTNFSKKTIEDCRKFILSSQNSDIDCNLAVTNDQDEYMGTVSLKHINEEEKSAEFAITIRKCAMGQGFSSYAMTAIFEHAYHNLGLRIVYWCVKKENRRAVRFYDKNRYERVSIVPDPWQKEYERTSNLIWYSVLLPHIKLN